MFKKLSIVFYLILIIALVVPTTTMAGSYECEDCGHQDKGDDTPSGGGNVLLKYLNLTSPTYGHEILGKHAGSVLEGEQAVAPITWESYTYGIDYVNILYSLDGGLTYHEIVTNYPNTGYYQWTLPNINANHVYVRISGYGYNGYNFGSDLSNAPFVIKNL